MDRDVEEYGVFIIIAFYFTVHTRNNITNYMVVGSG
jgi:hypothetical protein